MVISDTNINYPYLLTGTFTASDEIFQDHMHLASYLHLVVNNVQ